MVPANQVLLAQLVEIKPAGACRKIGHVQIEHGHGNRQLLEEPLQLYRVEAQTCGIGIGFTLTLPGSRAIAFDNIDHKGREFLKACHLLSGETVTRFGIHQTQCGNGGALPLLTQRYSGIEAD